MTAVLMSASYKDRAKKELQATAREVTASIREAQNNALTGKQKGTLTMPCAFQFQMNSGSYQIMQTVRKLDEADCSNAITKSFFNPVSLPLNIEMETRAFDPNATSAINNGDIIDFDVPYGKITIGGNSSYTGDEVILSKNNKFYHLCVHSTGLIEDHGITDSADRVCPFQ